MENPAKRATVNPALVRDFAVNGNGDFNKLKAEVEATDIALATDFGDCGGVLVTYVIASATEELVDRILKTIEECGFEVKTTRWRQVGSAIITSNVIWQDFAEFRASCASSTDASTSANWSPFLKRWLT